MLLQGKAAREKRSGPISHDNSDLDLQIQCTHSGGGDVMLPSKHLISTVAVRHDESIVDSVFCSLL